MIRSGSHVPGISPAAFRLPVGTAMRYERPAAGLAPLLPSYAVLDSNVELMEPQTNWMLPTWAQIWIRLTAGPISVAIGNRRYEPLEAAVLYGVTSRAMPTSASGGITVAIDVSPLGWSRFVAGHADAHRDRIVPLHEVLPAAFVHELAGALHASDRDLAVKAIIDHAFLRLDARPDPNEPTIARMMAAFADPAIDGLPAAIDAVGITPATMQRLCRRYFGFAPKLLMMRSRFMRTIARMLVEDGAVDHSAIPPGYHSVPHFLRDANRFLGVTPRRFLAMEMPYLRAALRARRLVIETPTPALDRPLPAAA